MSGQSHGMGDVRRRMGWPRALAAGFFALVLLLVIPATAWGGSYDVVACTGGPDKSWTQWADPGMDAYDACPNQPSNMFSGIITRASVGGGAAGYLQGGYQLFTAPPGAAISGMSFDAAPYRWEQHWTTGVVAFDGDFNRGDLPWGCYAGQPGCGIFPGSFFGRISLDFPWHWQVRIETRCGNSAGCTLASSGRTPYMRASMAIANVSVRVQDYTQPGINWTAGDLLSGGWVKGVQSASFDAYDNVGIRETRVRIDGGEIGARGKACDYTLRVPCPQGGDTYTLDTATVRPDGAHTLTAETVDTAGNLAQINQAFLVDNTAPAQPEDPVVEGGEGWRSQNRFHLTWENPLNQSGSPLAGVHFLMCPVAGGECEGGSQQLADPRSVDLNAPHAGEYVTRIWLRDEAGNEDPETAGPPVTLRFDNEAPALAFEPQSPSDPTQVSVRASDRVSGIARAEIELRMRAASAWKSLDTKLAGDHLTANLNDEALADGSYELRAHAIDRAGNERSTDRRTDGRKAELALPVRTKTALRAGVVKRSKIRGRARRKRATVRLLDRAHVGYGRRARISGLLTDATGAPVTDAQVLVSQLLRKDGAEFSEVGAVRTSGSGRFSYLAPPGASRTLRLRYPGTATIRPSTRQLSLLVAASTTLRVSRRFALNGETVTFSGRLRGRPLPDAGKLVELQAYARGRWRTFATSTAGARGTWRYDYRFDGTRGRQVYRFRARVPREGTYPYEVGRSRRVKVTVLGL